MSEMVLIKFVKPSPPYAAGEIAGFNTDIAERLIKGGVAEKTSAPKIDRKSMEPRDRDKSYVTKD